MPCFFFNPCFFLSVCLWQIYTSFNKSKTFKLIFFCTTLMFSLPVSAHSYTETWLPFKLHQNFNQPLLCFQGSNYLCHTHKLACFRQHWEHFQFSEIKLSLLPTFTSINIFLLNLTLLVRELLRVSP